MQWSDSTWMYTSTHVQASVHTPKHICTHINTHMYIHTNICTHVYTQAFAQMCVHIWTHANTPAYTHIYTYAVHWAMSCWKAIFPGLKRNISEAPALIPNSTASLPYQRACSSKAWQIDLCSNIFYWQRNVLWPPQHMTSYINSKTFAKKGRLCSILRGLFGGVFAFCFYYTKKNLKMHSVF